MPHFVSFLFITKIISLDLAHWRICINIYYMINANAPRRYFNHINIFTYHKMIYKYNNILFHGVYIKKLF